MGVLVDRFKIIAIHNQVNEDKRNGNDSNDNQDGQRHEP